MSFPLERAACPFVRVDTQGTTFRILLYEDVNYGQCGGVVPAGEYFTGLLETGIEWVVGAPFPGVYDFGCPIVGWFWGWGGPAFDLSFILVLIFALLPHAGSKRSR